MSLKRALEEKEDKTLTYRARVQYLASRLKECGYPLVAARLETSLLFGTEASGETVIEEIEGLLEVLTGDDDHYHR